jgi:hypothetical protein
MNNELKFKSAILAGNKKNGINDRYYDLETVNVKIVRQQEVITSIIISSGKKILYTLTGCSEVKVIPINGQQMPVEYSSPNKRIDPTKKNG